MKIKIYDTNKEASGCGCSCSCNTTSKYNIDNLIKDLKERQSDVDIKTMIVQNMSKDDLTNEFNEIFRLNKERIRINKNTIDFTLSKILPLIVVDKKIRCTKSIPTANELLKAIDKNTRVDVNSSCC